MLKPFLLVYFSSERCIAPEILNHHAHLLVSTSTVVIVPSTVTTKTSGHDEPCNLCLLGVVLFTMFCKEVPLISITAHRTAERLFEDRVRSKYSVIHQRR